TASPTTPTVKSTISCLGTTAPPEQNRSPDAYRNRDELIVDNISALRFVLGLVVLVAKREVTSGTFHLSRGVLSYEGQSLRTMVRHAYTAMYEHEWMSVDLYQTILDQLDGQIKRSG
ncbi:hypothetical protein, partial [Novosphingobium chloroacetimidivorans]|uniref:hypothetical protein n=1 Tax=Novosphingobium chloroacetimidivorans TaxID=1428314 RepID=UPI001C872D48